MSSCACERMFYLFSGDLASYADVLRGSSHIPAPPMSAECKDKFLSHCLQISTGDHMQIIRDPIGTVEVNIVTSQTQRTSSLDSW